MAIAKNLIWIAAITAVVYVILDHYISRYLCRNWTTEEASIAAIGDIEADYNRKIDSRSKKMSSNDITIKDGWQ